MEKTSEPKQHLFHKEIKTDDHLHGLSAEELITIVRFQNQRLTDLNFKLGVTENLLERIFRLNILPHSKLKLDMCTYMASKRGVTNGQEKFKNNKESNIKKDYKKH